MKTLRGYHFVGEALRDGRPVPEDGVWLKHEGPIMPCVSGLHMSEHPFDALKYAPGATLCFVELRGNLQPHGNPIDKWVGRERCIIKRIDAVHLLRRFAADQALSVKHLWDMPPIVERYLTTLDEGLRGEAKIVARAAVRGASMAAWEAARAAEVATWDEAWVAVNAARVAVEDVAWEAARAEFKRRVDEALGAL